MITFPNAKINLGLNIVSRRPDGYHNLETVFYPVPLTDVLEMVPSSDGETHLQCYGRPVDCPPDKNLVMKAFRLMPYLSFTAVMFTMAEGVAPSPWPQRPAHMTAAS